jgi:transposase-like protein
MYRASGSVPAVAAELGVAFETARRWLVEAGVELQPKGRPSANAAALDILMLKRRYEDGESIADLGRRFSVSPATIRSRLLDAGVELRPRPGWKY